MNGSDPLSEMKNNMKKSVKILKKELGKIHVGRANPKMVEDIEVDYYGTNTPLNQIANITAPDSGLLAIQPYDSSQIESIEKAILEADLGLNPNNDGSVIRIPVPKLSGERRNELTRIIKEKGQEAKVSIRNIRRDTNKELEAKEDEGKLTEDDLYRLKEEVDEITSNYSEKVDQLLEAKNKQIRSL